jgi:hypothetical protein
VVSIGVEYELDEDEEIVVLDVEELVGVGELKSSGIVMDEVEVEVEVDVDVEADVGVDVSFG